MASRRGNDPTRRLRADKLQKFARDVDRTTRDAPAAKLPDVGLTVGYADEESSANTRSTVLPETAAHGGLTPDSVPVLHVAPGDAAWFELHMEAQLILSAADGHATVAEIADKLALDRERVLAALARLVEQQLVKIR